VAPAGFYPMGLHRARIDLYQFAAASVRIGLKAFIKRVAISTTGPRGNIRRLTAARRCWSDEVRRQEVCLTETPEEFRRRVEDIDAKFFEQVNKRGEPHRSRSFEYEKLAIEYSHRGLQLLTYLNGGALVAIPTALAFFKADVGRIDVLLTAVAFIVGLLFVVLAQVAAFFTMAKRAEASMFSVHEQFQRIAALQNPHQAPEFAERMAAATSDAKMGSKRLATSDKWRLIGLGFFVLSLAAFVAGCAWGAWVVILAKEVASQP
jgi:hypothetical protein